MWTWGRGALDGARGRAAYIWKVSGLTREATGPRSAKSTCLLPAAAVQTPGARPCWLTSSSLKDRGTFVRLPSTPPFQSQWPATGPPPQTAAGQRLSEAAFIQPREGKYRNLGVRVCSPSTRQHPSPPLKPSRPTSPCAHPLGCCSGITDNSQHVLWGAGSFGSSWLLVAQSCLTLGYRWTVAPTRVPCPWNSPGKNTGVGCYSLLQGSFPTQRLNSSLLHCRQILYHLSHQGSLKEEWLLLGKSFSRGWLLGG